MHELNSFFPKPLAGLRKESVSRSVEEKRELAEFLHAQIGINKRGHVGTIDTGLKRLRGLTRPRKLRLESAGACYPGIDLSPLPWVAQKILSPHARLPRLHVIRGCVDRG